MELGRGHNEHGVQIGPGTEFGPAGKEDATSRFSFPVSPQSQGRRGGRMQQRALRPAQTPAPARVAGSQPLAAT